MAVSQDDELREWLARELHDTVANQLQTLLVDMELVRRQRHRETELREWQGVVRDVLLGLRQMLFELRGVSGGEVDAIRATIEGKLARAASRDLV